MRVLVTGGSGSIGSELVRQLVEQGHKVFIFDIDETRTYDLYEELKQKGHWVDYYIGDIRNRDVLRDVFSDFKPEMVYHAAALKHVSPAEKMPIEYVLTNVVGTQNVLDYASRWECCKKFIFISTDKVVNQSSVMGQSKRLAETIVTNAGQIAVRFGNVMGSRGSVLEIWQRQLDAGEKITVTDKDMERYMMSIQDACKLVLAASEGEPGDIWIMKMGELKNIYEMAQEFYPDSTIKIIGRRPGEELTERLMTHEEESMAVDIGDFWVIKHK